LRACIHSLARLSCLAPLSFETSAESANLGLKLLARGGVFLAGGIPGKLLPRIKATSALQTAFLRPDCRFAPVRASMPLHVVMSKDPGLDGARAVALRSLAES
jgi:glucokinase